VLVNKAHATMRNLPLESLDERAAYEMIRCFKAVTTLIASAVEATYG